ncbi:transcriptional regulator [Marinicauda salina]|uniref:Transcriptional regulator n=1 Tax=Marinicauda salina TaxID=2135793 RepID=A0A2U2BTW1_9PROT|nr:methyltransferase domain-containing protein [Marinicauda salina]PWE17456.1 transcriptional regulator [Marinicauda salina]
MSVSSPQTLDRFDEPRAEAFSEKIAGMLNAGAVTAMMAIGHRLGLYDVMSGMAPATSADIAARAELSERYVREWLAVMTMGGIVDYDPVSKTYALPAEHAACLTREAPLGNLAVYAQMVGFISSVQDKLIACFETGEGTTYDDYPCFHQVMAEDSAQTIIAGLFDVILPLVDGLADRLEAGIDVLDAGCGRGQALIAMAAKYPNSRFVGYDLCADAIDHADADVRAQGLDNIRFEQRDLSTYDEVDRFDFITSFDAIHDQKDPQDLLRRLHRALRPGGVYLVQDIGGSAHLEQNYDFPMAAMLYAISCAHCMPISLGQGGEGLGTMWGWETAEAMLGEAGFVQVERRSLEHDPMNVWFVSRKAAEA